MFSRLFGILSADMAIDLGTANTLVYVKGKGIVLRSEAESSSGETAISGRFTMRPIRV